MRCFLAVELGEEVKEELARVLAELRALNADLKPVAENQLHVTLAFFGEITEEQAREKIRRLEKIEARPFSVRVEGTGFFPSSKFVRVFYAAARSPELMELQKKAVTALEHKEDHPFTGHVTLARVRSPRGLDALRALQEKHSKTFFSEARVNEMVFKKSTLTREGPVYEDIARIPLRQD